MTSLWILDELAGRVTYEPCGCVTNRADAHRGDCPDWRTVRDINDRPLYWVPRQAGGGGNAGGERL